MGGYVFEFESETLFVCFFVRFLPGPGEGVFNTSLKLKSLCSSTVERFNHYPVIYICFTGFLYLCFIDFMFARLLVCSDFDVGIKHFF